jgi:hypothetical protein
MSLNVRTHRRRADVDYYNGFDLGNASSNVECHEGTSTHVEVVDEVVTASTTAAARTPSVNVGRPSGADPTIAL